ncbi:AI-2E family transporter [Nocardioides lianchengensis]|uniref:Predicted PurR-regulated permease PerM n=1 Tax=Nocardioides lianchengensis TaxID=1045774 RepID=A0A1G6X457_9ACTN|nr:AI-2E family transporter [Nocardioides lianchengensis]NYG09101.1 putative PurR-regulated permease PerM [Nocardioides lianchengensis]SDD72881.1 Predicted PurR-regulated permease PerM [Nocardioides lianchengensis]
MSDAPEAAAPAVPPEDTLPERTTVASPDHLGEPGPPLDHKAPFFVGLVGGLGFALAWWLFDLVTGIGSTLVLIVVAFFIAAGLNPVVLLLERRGLKRSYAVIAVIIAFLAALALFFVAIVPVITDQITKITDNAPHWLDELQRNRRVQDLNDEYEVVDKIRDYVTNGDFAGAVFGGALGIGLAVVGALFNAFIVLVLTLYFLASMKSTTGALYSLAPASRRDRVSRLGDRVIAGIGGYVSGAFVVALCAGTSTLVFLFIVGLGEYAVALAFVVALLDVIPMIGATLGAVVVTAIAFATDVKTGIICAIFFIIYQQLENYVIYPRVMSRSVDIPGAVTVIAALVGAALLGVVGALLAIPTAAAILMLVREVYVRRQDAR